jgi:hypothetical protein
MSVLAEAHAHDARLRAAAAEIGIAGPPVQVRNHNGAAAAVQSAAFMSSALPVAGFAVIEAATMDEAVRLASQTPCAVAQGVVSVIVTRRFNLTEPDDHALARSRDGWTTKLHLTCEQGRNVLSVMVTGGQRGDSPQFTTMLGRIRVPRVGGGRARSRPATAGLRRLERHLWNAA